MRRGYVLIPFINLWEEFTVHAHQDALQQVGVETHVLLINNGSCPEVRGLVDLAGLIPRTLVWHHNPPLPSLAATWNTALDFVWDAGGEEALVLNNDTRIHPKTYQLLLTILGGADGRPSPLFVSGVGIRNEQAHWVKGMGGVDDEYQFDLFSRGGPDFSCFMISKECHQKYRFDEAFIGGYWEDNDYHRQVIVGGDGARIFGVNVPFLHYGSQTINRSPEIAAAFAKKFERNRDYYRLKWGGPPGAELFKVPFNGKG